MLKNSLRFYTLALFAAALMLVASGCPCPKPHHPGKGGCCKGRHGKGRHGKCGCKGKCKGKCKCKGKHGKHGKWHGRRGHHGKWGRKGPCRGKRGGCGKGMRMRMGGKMLCPKVLLKHGEKLALTADQKAKLAELIKTKKPLSTAMKAKIKAAGKALRTEWKKDAPDAAALKTLGLELIKNVGTFMAHKLDIKIAATGILTLEQRKKMRAWKAKMRKHHGRRGRGHHGKPCAGPCGGKGGKPCAKPCKGHGGKPCKGHGKPCKGHDGKPCKGHGGKPAPTS